MASAAEFKALTEKVAALEALVSELKGSKPVKAKKSDDKPKRSNKANEYKEYVFKTAMKDEFDAFVEEAKKTAKDAGEKYNALKARNDFLKTLSDHATAKLKSDFEALSASGSSAASDAETAAAPAPAPAPKKARGGAKKAEKVVESDVGSASDAEAAPAEEKPAERKIVRGRKVKVSSGAADE